MFTLPSPHHHHSGNTLPLRHKRCGINVAAFVASCDKQIQANIVSALISPEVKIISKKLFQSRLPHRTKHFE